MHFIEPFLKLCICISICVRVKYSQERVRQYHEKIFEMSHGFDERSLFDGLPNELRAQVARNMYKAALQKVPMFADCDPGFLDALCTEVRPQICLPGDYIVRQGDIGFEVFFISSGVAEAVDATGKVYSRMAQGSFFGEIALFTLCPRSLSVVSRSMMELYSLHKVWRRVWTLFFSGQYF
jgi:hypothetical protein